MPEQKTETVVRLTPELYRKLEDQVPKAFVTDNTSPLQAGFQLGVQYVLRLIREGYTIKE